MTKRQAMIRGRLQEIRDVVLLGGTSSTGKTIRETPGGKIVGRHKGGMSILYPELKYAGLTPGNAARAIRRGKGKVYKRLVRGVVRTFAKQGVEFPKGYVAGTRVRDWRAGRKTVAPHAKLTKKCKVCKVAHTSSVHRFHGEGAMSKTHLFAFNPGGEMNKREYIKHWAKSLGLYLAVNSPGDGKTRYSFYRLDKEWTGAGTKIKRHIHTAVGIREAEAFIEAYRDAVQPNPKRRRVSRLRRPSRLSDLSRRQRREYDRYRSSLKNPRKPGTKIYEKVLEIRAQKGPGHKCDPGCARAGHRYYHRFSSKPKMYGLDNGDILIQS